MILITGFEPFDGRTRNGSETIARYLDGRQTGGEVIESTIVPVVWDEIEEFCKNTLANTDAVLILGFGEADCPRPRFERLARSQCIGIDNNGRSAPVVNSNAAPVACERLTCESDWFDDIDNSIDISEDAGAYLCNWYLFHALKHAAAPAGFIHVPIQRELADRDYVSAFGPCIEKFIDMNLRRE